DGMGLVEDQHVRRTRARGPHLRVGDEINVSYAVVGEVGLYLVNEFFAKSNVGDLLRAGLAQFSYRGAENECLSTSWLARQDEHPIAAAEGLFDLGYVLDLFVNDVFGDAGLDAAFEEGLSILADVLPNSSVQSSSVGSRFKSSSEFAEFRILEVIWPIA